MIVYAKHNDLEIRSSDNQSDSRYIRFDIVRKSKVVIVVASLLWDKNDYDWTFESVGLRWLQTERDNMTDAWICSWCGKKGEELENLPFEAINTKVLSTV